MPPVIAFLLSSQFWTDVAAVVGALMSLFGACGYVLGALGAYFPKLMPVAAWFTKVHDALGRSHLAGQAFGAKLRRKAPPTERAFVRLDLLLAVLAFGAPAAIAAFLLFGCGLGAAAPSALTLEQCEANVIHAQDGGIDFWTVVEQSIEQCGGDLGLTIADVVTALASSKDPALAPYVAEAKATLADPSKMQALRMGLKHQ